MTQQFGDPTRVPALEAGQTLLVAESGDLGGHDVDLRLLAERSDSSEGTAFVATKTDSERLLERYESLETGDASDVLGVVDAVSHDQNLPAPYRETPRSYVAGPHELARIALALARLTNVSVRENRRRHLVAESLTPLLEASDPRAVCRFVRQTLRNSTLVDGFSILTVDFTAHDQRIVNRVRDLADLVLWVEESPDGALTFDVEKVASPQSDATDE